MAIETYHQGPLLSDVLVTQNFGEGDKMTEPILSFDEEDVPAVLNRETFDGFGIDEIPPSDFAGFATEGVEKEEN
jgi:hypothetical protein